MTFGNSHVTQRHQIFSDELHPWTPFHSKSHVCSSYLLVVLSEQDINLNLFYDTNMLTEYDWCK
jgi:hypothetical protein